VEAIVILFADKKNGKGKIIKVKLMLFLFKVHVALLHSDFYKHSHYRHLNTTRKNIQLYCTPKHSTRYMWYSTVRNILINILYLKNTNKHDHFYIKNINYSDSVLPV